MAVLGRPSFRPVKRHQWRHTLKSSRKTESWEMLQAVRGGATYTFMMTTMNLPLPKAHLRARMAGNLKQGRNKGRYPEAQGWAL